MSSRKELANAIRALSMDAVQKAKSGHPGAPMGMADIAEVLWRDFLNHNPQNPSWADRDRFVLSNGHGSMLIYSLLHLTGYDLPMSELQNFRQLHSKTPGHPEVGYTAGVETTTGPLGQGIANAVGMAIAEKTLAAQFNRPGHDIVDHFTYAFMGDGCMMEGISHEVCSLAGTLKLGKLIAFYDDNGISIDGHVEGWFTDDTAKRFEAYGWHVVRGVDGHDADAVVVVQSNQLAQAPGTSERNRLLADALHQAAIAQEGIGVVVHHGVAGAVELSGQQLFCQRHAHGIGNALAQRAGGGFHAGGVAHFRVAGGFAAQLAEVFQLFNGQGVTRQVQECVNQHRAVAVGQHKAVAVGPLRVGRVVLQMLAPQRHGHVGHAHGGTGVAGFGLLNSVHSQGADRVGHRLGVCHGRKAPSGWK